MSVILQAQIQELTKREVGVAALTTEVAKPQRFNETSSKVPGFIMICKLYIRMKIRGVVVEKQIQWVLSYIQGESADI